MNHSLAQWGMGALGLPTERSLPRFAERRFSSEHFASHEEPDAILIIDTFSEWNHPEVGWGSHELGGEAGLAAGCARIAGRRLLRPASHKQGAAG